MVSVPCKKNFKICNINFRSHIIKIKLKTIAICILIDKFYGDLLSKKPPKRSTLLDQNYYIN